LTSSSKQFRFGKVEIFAILEDRFALCGSKIVDTGGSWHGRRNGTDLHHTETALQAVWRPWNAGYGNERSNRLVSGHRSNR
jgi:hypothetical protein